MLDALDGLVRQLGLAPVAELSPFSRSRRYANWHVRLDDGSGWLLRIATAPPGHRGLAHEAAARERLQASQVPVVERYRLIPADVFGAPASMSTWIDGQSGIGVLDVHPDAFGDLCGLCGRITRALELDTAGSFGMGVVDGRFLPVRPTWRAELRAAVHDHAWRAEAVGASLGPLGVALLARFEALLPALDAARAFTLVHGDLNPSNLVLHVGEPEAKDQPPPMEVRGVVDWELAGMADPLLALAGPLELPDEALAHFVDGYGAPEIAGHLADPLAIDRIEAYAIARVFQYLALVVSAQIEAGGSMWGYGIAYAQQMAEERVEPGFARRRLEAVLAMASLPQPAPLPDHARPVPAALRRALGRLGCRPTLGASAVGAWMGAVAAALRDATHPDEGWVHDAHLQLDLLGPEVEQRGFEPITSRADWLARVGARVVELAGEDGLLLGLWWLAIEALSHVSGSSDPRRWAVPDATLRGLEGFLEGAAPALSPGQRAEDVLLRGVVALAAGASLAGLGGTDDSSLRASRVARLVEAWEDVTVFGGPSETSAAGASGPRQGASRGGLVPLVLLATDRAGELPVPRDALVEAIGRGLASG